MHKFGFVMEQTLGHATHCENLAATVAIRREIEPVWMPVSFKAKDRWDRIRGIRDNWTLKGSLRARALLKQHHAAELDALLIHTQTIALFAQPWMRGVPTIISLDATPKNIDSLGEGYGHHTANRLVEDVKQVCVSRVFERAARLVCWSKWAADSLKSDYGAPSDAISVVPPGVDILRWRSLERSWDGKRPIRLLFVGGDFARKGGPNLLRAFAEDLHNGFTLDVVTRDEILSQAEGLAGVTVHRDLPANGDAIRDLYHRADIFVLPTLADCLPIALLEAMAAGLPCVTTRVGAIDEVVVANVNGLFVPPDASVELAKAIREITATRDRLAEMSGKSARIAAEKYDAERNHGTILAMMTMLSRSR